MTKTKSYLFIFISVITFFIAFIVGKKYFLTTKNNSREISLSINSYHLTERIKNEADFITNYKGKYIELEGVLVKIVNGSGASTIFLTSGYQTDSSFLVGRPLLKKTLIHSSNVYTPCDSLILQYGATYNLQENTNHILISGNIINDDDSLSQYKYYKTCEYSTANETIYQLENFCIENVNVRATLENVSISEKEIFVELGDVLLISKTKIEKKIIN